MAAAVICWVRRVGGLAAGVCVVVVVAEGTGWERGGGACMPLVVRQEGECATEDAATLTLLHALSSVLLGCPPGSSYVWKTKYVVPWCFHTWLLSTWRLLHTG